MSLKTFLGLAAASLASCAIAGVTHWAVPAISSEMRLPDRDPADGVKNAIVTIQMARNEYEPASFVVMSDTDLGKVEFKLDRFATADGAVLPPESLDLKLIKVWYQDRNAWFSYFGDSGGVKLCPELLLNDEDLIRVDPKTQSNYARITEKDGSVREAWLSAPRQLLKRTGSMWIDPNFKNMAPGFVDAKTLQPVSLGKNERKQFFLTVHTTKETKAGEYSGAVRLEKGGKFVASIPVVVKVLPFTLGRPKTYVRPDEDFLIAHIAYLYLDIVTEMNGGDRELAKKQLQEVFNALERHGDNSICLRGHHPSPNPTDDFNTLKERYEYLFQVDALKKAGLRTDFLVAGNAIDYNYSAKDFNYDFLHEQAVKRMAEFKKVFGHGNVYASFGDEPGGAWLVKYRPLFEAYRDAGYKFGLAGWGAIWAKAHDYIDWHTIGTDATNPDIVGKRNQLGGNGCKSSWYACMHMGVENPDLQRRQNGLPAYLTGYTSFMNYAYHLGPYNDDAIRYRPMVMFYGCGNGVLDTIQWEGQREGVDDIRYASYMKSLADKACASETDSIRRLGRQALAFFANVDVDADEPSYLRAEISNYILRLIAAVGELPEEKPVAECKPFALPEDPVIAQAKKTAEAAAAAAPKPVEYHRLDINHFRNKAVNDLEGTKADFAVSKTNANSRLSAAQKYEIEFMLESFGYGDMGIDALAGKFKGLDNRIKGEVADKDRVEAIEWVGTTALKRGMNDFGRAIWKFRNSFIQKQPDLTYTVKWSEKPIRNATDWETVGAREEPLTRPFGDNDLSFLVTDVSTGNRGEYAAGGNKASKDPASFAVAADYWGVHFRFTDMTKDSLLIRDRVKGGAGWEVYIAAGFDAPYVCALFNQGPELPCEFWNTAYSAKGLRRIPKTMLPSTFRYAKTYSEFYPDRVCSYIDLSWENYANAIPSKESLWPFEPARWRDGNPTWNGLRGIHCRSSWGMLKFDIPEAGYVAIWKHLLLLCKQGFGEAVGMDRWDDDTLGDRVFAETCLKPVMAKYKPVLDAISPEMDDKAVIEIAGKHLADLWDMKYTVQRMRERFISGAYEKVYPSTDVPVFDATVFTNSHRVVSEGTPDKGIGYHYGVSYTAFSNGDQMKCVWANGKGGKCGPYATSKDRGKTWVREDGRLPEAYSNYYCNCPVIREVHFDSNSRRHFIFATYDARKAAGREAPFNRGPTASGTAPLGIVYSDDNGATWKEAAPADLPADMAPTGIANLGDGRIALFGHVPVANGDSGIWMSVSSDKGITWSPHKIVAKKAGCAFGEPCVVRSRDGKGIGLVIAEDKERKSSYFVLSNDNGATWSEPKELSCELAGVRHEALRLNDGQYFIAFRDRKPGSPTHGQLVAWVGRWEDLTHSHSGVYRIHLEKSEPFGDDDFSCASCGISTIYGRDLVVVSNAKTGNAPQPGVMMQMMGIEDVHGKIRPKLRISSMMWY